MQLKGSEMYEWKIKLNTLRWYKPLKHSFENYSTHDNFPHFLAKVGSAAAKSLQSCATLCNPIDGSLPGSPLPGILQTRTLEWLPFPLQCMKVKSESEVAQSCPTPSEPVDCSLPGSSAHGIFQASVLEWVAIAFSIGYGEPINIRRNL